MKDIVESIDVNGVTFYPSYFKAIRRIPDDEIRLEAYDVICGYMMTGTLPDDMSWQIESIFDGLKPNIDTSRKNSKNGAKKTKAEAKPKRTKSETETKQKPNKNETETKAEQIEIEEEIEKEFESKDIKPSLSTKSASAARFSIFWQTYPKRVRQTDAEEEWEKLSVDSELFDRIIKALNVAKESDEWKRENGRFIPHPSNWLKDRRWEDEPVNVRAPAKKNKFANFHQRDRSQEDFDELEKQMLQRRTGHEEKSNQNNKDNESNGDTPARAV
jgi:hypothetical protein